MDIGGNVLAKQLFHFDVVQVDSMMVLVEQVYSPEHVVAFN